MTCLFYGLKEHFYFGYIGRSERNILNNWQFFDNNGTFQNFVQKKSTIE